MDTIEVKYKLAVPLTTSRVIDFYDENNILVGKVRGDSIEVYVEGEVK